MLKGDVCSINIAACWSHCAGHPQANPAGLEEGLDGPVSPSERQADRQHSDWDVYVHISYGQLAFHFPIE